MKRRRYNIDLCSHLDECDANYGRLMALTEGEETVRVALGDAVPDVTFEVVEQSRHTSVIAVRQKWTDYGLADTSIKVRVYHDAKSAEVIECHSQRRFDAVYDYPNRKMRQRDEKAQINRFLSEFLSLCLVHGEVSVPAVMGS